MRKGTVLRLRDDLEHGKAYGVAKYFNDMLRGKVVVKKYNKVMNTVTLENDFQGNVYTPEMFKDWR